MGIGTAGSSEDCHTLGPVQFRCKPVEFLWARNDMGLRVRKVDAPVVILGLQQGCVAGEHDNGYATF